jgi:hypothetical protein
MRGQAMVLAASLIGLAAPADAQSDAPRTAEQFIETARETYAVRQEPAPCATPVGNEIIVCRKRLDPDSQRLQSPTERAYAAGEMPPDPIPGAPYVLGLPECGVEVTCHRVGRAPPPIYIIDLAKIPEPLTTKEAARVFRAEDLPPEASPAAASPAEDP